VDFDPVIDNALAAGHAIPEDFAKRVEQRQKQQTKGAANKTTESTDFKPLFPNAFEYTEEIGWIPKGWRVSLAGREFNTVGGTTPSTKNETFWKDGDINWTTPKDLSNNQTKILLNTARKITLEGLEKISSGLLPINTVLMSSRAPVGYLALTKIPVAINQGYIAIKCEKILTSEYAIQWADAVMNDIKQRAGGTTFAEISKKSFRDIPLLVPKKELVDSFTKTVSGFYTQITNNEEITLSLTKLRDTLLPKLLSGEIRIPDAEKLIAEVK
jgi:type I restriction enzyme S subunit